MFKWERSLKEDDATVPDPYDLLDRADDIDSKLKRIEQSVRDILYSKLGKDTNLYYEIYRARVNGVPVRRIAMTFHKSRIHVWDICSTVGGILSSIIL